MLITTLGENTMNTSASLLKNVSDIHTSVFNLQQSKTMVDWATKNLEIFSQHSPLQNNLLASLPKADFNRLEPYLELVSMQMGKVMYDCSRRLDYIYFPTTSIVSLLYVLADGKSSETAMVGKEGMLGISLLMGGENTPICGMVRSAGFGYRIKIQVLKNEFNQNALFRDLLLRYTQAMMTQVTQTAVCNRHHLVEQQLCRCILLSLDRLNSNALAMTQELISNILGVRREGITEAAGKLQRKGLISYNRGRIEVLDRLGLEKSVCECYSVVKSEYARLLPNAHSCVSFN